MIGRFVRSASTDRIDGPRCSRAIVPIVHSPYYGYGSCVEKPNVIGRSYDLWRRRS